MTELRGRRTIVTGAAKGMGRRMARHFAEAGAEVSLVDVDASNLEVTGDELRSAGHRAHTFVRDLSSLENVRTLRDEIHAELGRIDILVNNAGVLIRKPFTSFDEAEYDRIMDVNVKGTFFTAQLAAERMLEQDGGSIINISSVSGILGAAETVAYCASKGAIRLMTYALADELGPEIRVNAIHPGAVETMQAKVDSEVIGSAESQDRLNRIPAGRFGVAGDIADAALYLASDRASYVTGASLVVDGGDSTTR